MLKVINNTRKPAAAQWHETPSIIKINLRAEYLAGRLKQVELLNKTDEEISVMFLWATVDDFNRYRIKISSEKEYQSYVSMCMNDGYCWSKKMELVND